MPPTSSANTSDAFVNSLKQDVDDAVGSSAQQNEAIGSRSGSNEQDYGESESNLNPDEQFDSTASADRDNLEPSKV